MLNFLFKKDPVRSQAETLYAAIAEQALAPEFFMVAGAPDTPEGRFDMIALHMFLAVERLRRDAPANDRLVQRLQEVFFEHLDGALREMGVGDLSVGRKIRGLAEAFYGRYAAYRDALFAGNSALSAAIARNVLGLADTSKGAPLADYAVSARGVLGAAAVDNLPTAIAALGSLSRSKFRGEGDEQSA
jgi:cytochrome b pre-mRNA-processing protein 3